MIGSLASLAGVELRDVVRRNLRTGVLLASAAVFLVGASAFGLSALSRELAARYGVLSADLMIGGSLALIGVLIAILAWVLHRQRRSSEVRKQLVLAAAPLAFGVGRKFAPSLIKAAPLVLLAGILAGRMLSSRE